MKYIKKILFIMLLIPLLVGYKNVYAASAGISVTASSSKITVGDTVTYTVKVSSSSLLGSIVYSFNYDSNKLTLTSGTLNAALAFTGTEKSATYTFKFKAKASGEANVSFVINELLDWDGNEMSYNKTTSKTITIITQQQLQASYSSNNYLLNLKVDSYTLLPTFNKNTLSYSLEVENSVREVNITCTKEDSKSYVNGCGKVTLEEGLNKKEIKVTAQNGSTKTYILNITVKELEPINVIINNEEFTVVRKKENLTLPNSNFEESSITIEEKEVPSFVNQVTNTTLVGLKNKDGDITLYSYKDGYYTKYIEIKSETIIITEEKLEKIPYGYTKETININGNDIEAYKEESNSEFYLLKGKNIENGETAIYQYDTKEKTLQLYNSNLIKKHEEAYARRKKIDLFIILGLTLLLFTTYLTIIIKFIQNKKRRNDKRRIKKEI